MGATISALEKAYLTKMRRKPYIALETMDFIWDIDDVKAFIQMWKHGESIQRIAEHFGRPVNECAVLVMDLRQKRTDRAERKGIIFMTFNEYQQLASRTANSDESGQDLLTNFALGLACEAGETADLIKKYRFHGHPLKREELVKELGDVLWYASQIANLAAIDFNEVAESNIAKLMKRYPDGFNSADSIKRVDVKEAEK